MSKKQRRSAAQPTAARTAAPTVETPAAPVAPVVRRTISTNPTEFNPDYTPILKDLRRIGMLAGSFFVLLVILSFFLN